MKNLLTFLLGAAVLLTVGCQSPTDSNPAKQRTFALKGTLGQYPFTETRRDTVYCYGIPPGPGHSQPRTCITPSEFVPGKDYGAMSFYISVVGSYQISWKNPVTDTSWTRTIDLDEYYDGNPTRFSATSVILGTSITLSSDSGLPSPADFAPRKAEKDTTTFNIQLTRPWNWEP